MVIISLQSSVIVFARSEPAPVKGEPLIKGDVPIETPGGKANQLTVDTNHYVEPVSVNDDKKAPEQSAATAGALTEERARPATGSHGFRRPNH